MAETAKWYVVHTYSGYENTVKATIEKTVESIDIDNNSVSLLVSMFGRETSVEFQLDEVEVVSP